MREVLKLARSERNATAFEDRAARLALVLGILAWCATPIVWSFFSGCAGTPGQ